MGPIYLVYATIMICTVTIALSAIFLK